MKKIITAALGAAVLALGASQAMLWKRVNEIVSEPEEKKPEKDEYTDYLEKLWAKGLEGIMSYGISDAMGKGRIVNGRE